MFIVEIFLPLGAKNGTAFSQTSFDEQKALLVEKFGGLTVYARAPAEGLWDDGDQTVADSIVVFEVIADELDHEWWRSYREMLEERFDQDSIVIRATASSLL